MNYEIQQANRTLTSLDLRHVDYYIDDEPAAAICEALVVTWHAVLHEL